MPHSINIQVDVFICGGGPVGLLMAYQLTQMGISTYVVEQYNKAQQETYGRACTIYPRTLEMLDQLDLSDKMSQIGFIARRALTYNNGERIYDRGFQTVLDSFSDTFFDYNLNLRQKYTEDVFRGALARWGGRVHDGVKLINYVVDDTEEDYKVIADIQDGCGTTYQVKSKYIVGADGGHSTVRKISQIPFPGEDTSTHWVRMDAVVRTNMPSSRIGYGSIESSTHGNVLWIALDHSRTRIGYLVPPVVYALYGDAMPESVARAEAVKAVAPFSLDILSVDWFSQYRIGRHVAATFHPPASRLLLAGDAAHTHSSGVAQGINTGIHDAVNLAWKLGGVLRHQYSPSFLDTYNSERHPIAEKLLGLDRSIAALISGAVPAGFPTDSDPNKLLEELFVTSAQFTSGLGIFYPPNILNASSVLSAVKPGHRGPDVLLHRPGNAVPTRLHSVTKNDGRFWIVVFAGSPTQTGRKLKTLRKYLDSLESFTNRLKEVWHFMTVVAGPGAQVDEALGVERFGKEGFWDENCKAHERYGLEVNEGGIVVLRPDGILGCVVELDGGRELGEYFEGFVERKV